MTLVFLVFAFVCFVVATWRIGQPDWPRLIAAGLAFWVATQFLTQVLGR